MTDVVSTETIIRLVKQSGSDATLDGEMLSIHPKGGDPVVYRVPSTGLKRRIIIQIADKVGVAPHLFWDKGPAKTDGAQRAGDVPSGTHHEKPAQESLQAAANDTAKRNA